MFRNFFFTTLVLLLSIGILWITVTDLDPFGVQSRIARTTFFLALFTGVGSLCTFVFFFGAEVFRGKRLGSRKFLVAMRRGILLSVYFTTYMLLEWLNFWGILEATLLAVFLVLLEWIASTKK